MRLSLAAKPNPLSGTGLVLENIKFDEDYLPPRAPEPDLPAGMGVIRTYPEWVSRFRTGDPVYAIPTEVLDSVCRPGEQGRTPPLFEGTDADAERAHTRLCDEHRAVGTWWAKPFACPLLRPEPTGIRPGSWAEREAEIEERLRGVAGWLLTDPAFLEHTQYLMDYWEALGAAVRPEFPLGFASVKPSGTTTGEEAEFHDLLAKYLARWGLSRLVTPGLPEPQRLEWTSPGAAGRNRGWWDVTVVIPVHYPVQGRELIRQIRERQQDAAARMDVAAGFAAVAHVKAYARMFRLHHLERTLASRFPSEKPRGFAGHVIAAAMTSLGLSYDQVRKLRKGITACRSGKRAQVRWLK